MSEQNLSQWFDLTEQKPWEVGVYQVEYESGSKGHSYFDGSVFKNGWLLGNAKSQIQDAFNARHTHETCRILKWRGLSTNPEVKKKAQNRRKTMYVVMKAISNSPVASFSNVNAARDYAGRVNFPVRIRRIRFRTPE